MSAPREGRWQSVPPGSDLTQTDPSRKGAGGSGSITIIVNGQSVPAHLDDTVATALLRAGHVSFGAHPKTGQPLAPTCMMGVCFGCLCTIDGRPGSQACLEPVRDGLTVQTEGPTLTSAQVPAP